MELMRGFPDKHFDLAIVDPPYGIGENLVKGGGNQGCWGGMTKSGADKWDVQPKPEYFAELFRVSKNQIIWGGNYFDLPPSKMPICWDKVRPNQKCASEWEYAWTSFSGRARLFKYCANGGFVEPEPRIHPTQKPVALYDWLLRTYAKPGQRVLDTHLGSGSHAIAAHYFGAHLTACEIDADYYAAAMARIKRETAQTTLFT
jgi:site-specific DNA-methyltransferase (adenine-specific)